MISSANARKQPPKPPAEQAPRSAEHLGKFASCENNGQPSTDNAIEEASLPRGVDVANQNLPTDGEAHATLGGEEASTPMTNASTVASQRATDGSQRELIDRKAPATTNLREQALADMIAARRHSGSFTEGKWTPKAIAVVKASLGGLAAWGDEGKAKADIIALLKKERGGRGLNKANAYLVAIHYCSEKPTPQQRKEWSRFADVIMVAHRDGVKPSEAEDWLVSKTQKVILDKARQLKGKSDRKTFVFASKSVRPTIWNAIKAGKGELYDLTVDALDNLEKQLASLRDEALQPDTVAKSVIDKQTNSDTGE